MADPQTVPPGLFDMMEDRRLSGSSRRLGSYIARRGEVTASRDKLKQQVGVGGIASNAEVVFALERHGYITLERRHMKPTIYRWKGEPK